MNYIDTHSHFNLSQFDDDCDEAIARMEAHDTATICVGIDYESSKLAVELAHKHASIWAIIGQHPTDWGREFEKNLFEALADKPKVVAIGECGLDYYRDRDRIGKEEQKKLFQMQIALAVEKNLPLMLHIRAQAGTMDAYDDALVILQQYKEHHPTMIGTAHFFAGDTRIAQAFLDLGFYISFAGPITFARDYDAVVRMVPLDRILSETDAPFAAPEPYRGTRCEPWHVVETVKKIAEIKGVSIGEAQATLVENAKTLFRL